MDEAVLRIVLQDAAAQGTTQSSAPSSASTTAPILSSIPPPPPQRTTQPPPPPSSSTFDPVAEAQKRFEREQRAAQIDLEYAKLSPSAPPPSTHDLALKRLEAEKQRQEIEAEYTKLSPLVPEPTAHDLAVKRLEAEKKRQAIEAEYAKLNPPKPPPVFDPMAEAQKRREAERRRAQVEEAYKKQFGSDEKEDESPLKSIVNIAGQLRGSLGGVFGTIVGGVLDFVTAFRGIQDATKESKTKHDQLLSEITQPKTKEEKPTPQPRIHDVMRPDEEFPEVQPVEPSAPAEPPTAGTPFQPPTAAEPVPTAGAKASPPPTSPPAAGEAAEGAGAEAAGAEAAGGAAGGAMAGAAAAAGPIGAIIAVVEIAKKINKELDEAIKGAISGIGKFAAAIASPNADPSVPLGQLGDATSKAGEKLDEYVPIVGKVMIVTGEATKALAGLMQALDQTAKRYGEYSPEVAQAQAIADVRQTLGDLQRSSEVGPELAKYVQAQSDMQQKFEDIKVKLLVQILPAVTNIVGFIERVADATDKSVEIASIVAKNGVHVIDAANEIKRFLEEDAEKKKLDVEDPTSILFKDPADGGVRVPNF